MNKRILDLLKLVDQKSTKTVKFDRKTKVDFRIFKSNEGTKVCVGDLMDISPESFAVIELEEISNRSCIIIDENLIERMSDEEIEFFFYHELGHIKYQHFKKLQNVDIEKERAKAFNSGGVAEFELQADDFAMRKIGIERSMKGLNDCATRIIHEKHFDMKDTENIVEEILRRIDYLVKASNK